MNRNEPLKISDIAYHWRFYKPVPSRDPTAEVVYNRWPWNAKKRRSLKFIENYETPPEKTPPPPSQQTPPPPPEKAPSPPSQQTPSPPPRQTPPPPPTPEHKTIDISENGD